MNMRNCILLFTTLALIFTISSCSSTKDLVDMDYIELDTIDVIGKMKEDPYRPSATRKFDLINTRLDLSFNWENRQVIGEALLDLKAYFYNEQFLLLDAKGFDIFQIALVENDTKSDLEYVYDSTKIVIDLGREFNSEENFQVYIRYNANPDRLVKGSPSLKDNKGLFFIDPDDEDPHKPSQIWTQGETESSSCWFPTIDKPNERCTQEIYVTVQDKYTTFSNGLLLSSINNEDGTRTDYWKQSIPHAPYLFALVVGEYAVENDNWRDIEVDYFVEPKFKRYAKDIFGNTPEMLEFYSNYLGVDYPWEKYHQIVVRDFVAGAMENTSATIHFSGLHQTKRELLDEDHEDIIAHEIAHHWFGDLVTCESWSNIPLNESFATYAEYLWFEHKYGKEFADYHLATDLRSYLREATTKQVPLIRYRYDHPDDMFDRHSYQKGGRVLHMLRDYVGEKAFRLSLQHYLKEHEYNSVEIHDLRQSFEVITGEDLNWFFDQWFLNLGHPILDIRYQYDEEAKLLSVIVDQKPSDEEAGIFRMPVALDIYSSTGVKRHDIVVDEAFETFEFKMDEKPLLVNFDANKMLLCEKTDNKDLAEWIYQYKNAPLMLDRYEAVSHLANYQENEDVHDLMIDAIADPFFRLRQKVISELAVKAEKKAMIESLLANAVKSDEKSLVRMEALDKLISIETSDLKDICLQSLNDSSYLVAATALDGLFDVDSALALDFASKLESVDNYDMEYSVATIYCQVPDEKYQDYFENQISSKGGRRLYNYMYFYAYYLGNMGYNENLKGIETIKTNAKNASSKWVKIAGKEGLEDIELTFKKQDQKNGRCFKESRFE